jgi:hypothetical protein
MRPLFLPIFGIAFLLFAFMSCKKSSTTIQGSPYTASMCGTRLFHYTYSGTNVNTHIPFTDSNNVSLTINFIDAATVSIGGEQLKYDTSTQDSVLSFSDPNAHSNGRFWQYDISYHRFTNQIHIYRVVYISAAGGTTTETWDSF